MTKREINEVVSVYNYLIKLAEDNIDKRIRMEWGNWTPTQSMLNVLTSRRDKIKGGALTPYKLNKGAN